jgi:hypothetical protein
MRTGIFAHFDGRVPVEITQHVKGGIGITLEGSSLTIFVESPDLARQLAEDILDGLDKGPRMLPEAQA